MATTKLRFREDTAQNWKIANPVLASSEPAREIDTGKIKIGDGITAWNNLAYLQTAGGSDVVIDNTVTVDNTEVLNTLSANKTESDNKLDAITTKLNSLDTVDSKLVELKSIIENLEVSGGDIESMLNLRGYCIVNYWINDRETIQEIAKIGSICNYNNYDRRIQEWEERYFAYIFMGYTKEPNFNPNDPNHKIVTHIDGSCTLYPVYGQPDAGIPACYAVKEAHQFWTYEDYIYQGIGTNVFADNATGIGATIIGYTEDPNSIEPISEITPYPQGVTYYGIIGDKDGNIYSMNSYVNNQYAEKKYGVYANSLVTFHFMDREMGYAEEMPMYMALVGRGGMSTSSTTWTFYGWSKREDSTDIIDAKDYVRSYDPDDSGKRLYAVYQDTNGNLHPYTDYQ